MWVNRVEVFKTFAFALLAIAILTEAGCALSSDNKLSLTSSPTATPEVRVIKSVDIVERADAMCKKEGDCRQALILYSQAIRERGESAELLQKRGMAYYALKQIESAINDFSKAITLSEKENPELYFIRGLSRTLLKVEDREGACVDFRAAKKADFKNENVSRKEAQSFNDWLVDYCQDENLRFELPEE